MQKLLGFFSSLCSISCRLSLDDIPEKETVHFTISSTLTWAVLHNRNKPRIVPAWGRGAHKDDTRVKWQPEEISTDFHSFCLYAFQMIRAGKVFASFLVRCENWWYVLKKKSLCGGCYVKVTSATNRTGLTVASWLTDVTCIGLHKSASQAQPGGNRGQEEIQAPLKAPNTPCLPWHGPWTWRTEENLGKEQESRSLKYGGDSVEWSQSSPLPFTFDKCTCVFKIIPFSYCCSLCWRG